MKLSTPAAVKGYIDELVSGLPTVPHWLLPAIRGQVAAYFHLTLEGATIHVNEWWGSRAESQR